MHLLKYNPEAVTTTTAATPAQRKLAALWVESEHLTASLTYSNAAMLGWANRGGKYSTDDLRAVLECLQIHLADWVAACDQCDDCCAVYSAEDVLTWLGS
jgi:hypothetical protein